VPRRGSIDVEVDIERGGGRVQVAGPAARGAEIGVVVVALGIHTVWCFLFAGSATQGKVLAWWPGGAGEQGDDGDQRDGDETNTVITAAAAG
jgi:hypothetical protein